MFVTLSILPSHLLFFTGVTSSSSEQHKDSEGEPPQHLPKSEQIRMTRGGKSLKPPKAPKKNQESESKGNEEEIPAANTQSDDDDAVVDALPSSPMEIPTSAVMDERKT